MPMRFATLAAAQDWLLAHGAGRAVHLVVLHDETCLHGRNHACTCEPEFVVEDMSVEALVQGERAQRRWLDRHRRN